VVGPAGKSFGIVNVDSPYPGTWAQEFSRLVPN
jgi:hypothetical protein